MMQVEIYCYKYLSKAILVVWASDGCTTRRTIFKKIVDK